MEDAFHELDTPVGQNSEGTKAGTEKWPGTKRQSFRTFNVDKGQLEMSKWHTCSG